MRKEEEKKQDEAEAEEREEHMQVEAMQWAQETFGAAELGDVRRTRRLVRLAAQMLADPEGSLPRQTQGNWSDLKAAYRLLRAAGVSHEAISQPYWQQSRRRAEQEAEVLLVHDDTEWDYGSQSEGQGLGPIGNGSHRGLLVHSVLALVPVGDEERVLGLVAQTPWVRQPAEQRSEGRQPTRPKRRKCERESAVWWQSVQQLGRPPSGTRWIHVGDRYADMLPFLQSCVRLGSDFVVRAAQNRRLWTDTEPQASVEYLLEEVRNWPAQASGTVEVASEHERRARQAHVQLSWGQVWLRERDEHGRPTPGSQPLRLQVVRVWEPAPPSQTEGYRTHSTPSKHGHGRRARSRSQDPEHEPVAALEWILLTSLPVPGEAQAWHLVRIYQARWMIEDFHRGLKSGCRLEWARLQEEGSLENLLAICSPIAVHLLTVREFARLHPEEPARAWVDPHEVQVVAAQAQQPVELLRMRQFVRQVARLGGFLGRKSDGEPGWQTPWQGWMRVHWMVAGIRFAATAADASPP
jgi:Transposase DNA-binding/Transposase Tn5 dimerisation domain